MLCVPRLRSADLRFTMANDGGTQWHALSAAVNNRSGAEAQGGTQGMLAPSSDVTESSSLTTGWLASGVQP